MSILALPVGVCAGGARRRVALPASPAPESHPTHTPLLNTIKFPRLRNAGVYPPPSCPAVTPLWWGSVRRAKALTRPNPNPTLAQALGLEAGALKPTHRLDEGTEGLVVVARTAAFASYFQSLMKLNKPEELVISKQYRCLSVGAPPLGKLEHRLHIGCRFRGSPKYSAVLRGSGHSPTGVPEQAAADCHACSLEVLDVRPLAAHELSQDARDALMEAAEHGKARDATAQAAAVAAAAAAAADRRCGGGDDGVLCFESTIQLFTGRTHQIRAQLTSTGCPLVGDALYGQLHRLGAIHGTTAAAGGGEASGGGDTPVLVGVAGRLDGERIDWTALLGGEDGRSRIALQACRLEVRDEGMGASPVVFHAREPWWRATADQHAAVEGGSNRDAGRIEQRR